MTPIFGCSTCGSCEIQCLSPHRENIVDIIEELRAQAVFALGSLPAHAKFRDYIKEVHNPYGSQHHARSLVTGLGLPEKAEYVYFIGCTSNYRETEIRDATISVLKKAGIDFTIVDEYCCSSPLLRTGQRGPVKVLAQHNVSAIRESGAKRVVMSCSGCYRTFTKDYPRLGIEMDFEVIHMTQLLTELFRGEKLSINPDAARPSVTYHDPCHLGRASGIYDEPREVIAYLEVIFQEIEPNKENAWCCGAGGGCKSAFEELALDTAAKRIQQAKDTGSKLLMSACPFCSRNLSDGCDDDSLEILDLVELVDRMT